MASLLLSVKRRRENEQNARLLAKLALEADVDTPLQRPGVTAGGDEERLRGLPAIGRGVSGARPETRPGYGLR